MLHTERAGAVRFMHVKLLHHASIAIKTLITSALDNGTKYLHYMTYSTMIIGTHCHYSSCVFAPMSGI